MQGRLFAIVVVVLTVFSSGWAQPARAAKEDDYYELMKVFVDTFEQIDRNYVNQVDRRELLEAAVQGMLLELDPYSSYIDPERLSDFNQQVEQEFGGVGIQVTLDRKTRRITVMTPLPGTPAYRAGILAGDQIVAINGEKTAEFPKGEELATAVKLMKGKPGEPVKLSVLHEGSANPEEIEVERAIIKVATALGDHYERDGSWSYFLHGEDRIGYVRLTSFSRNSVEEMQAALAELTEQNMRGLVLDLRFNPGGLLSAATQIADMFVDSGTIVSTKGRNTEEQVVSATAGHTYGDFPMVVLVNRFSASASEIVSACLQDHDRALVVGERTWGKGSVQNVIELENGRSALKLTTATYHRPSGKNIHRFDDASEDDEWGVMPDDNYKIRMSQKQIADYLEYRRDRDVIRPEGPPDSSFVDPHLTAGLRWLHAELGDGPADAIQPANARTVKANAAADAALPRAAPRRKVAQAA